MKIYQIISEAPVAANPMQKQIKASLDKIFPVRRQAWGDSLNRRITSMMSRWGWKLQLGFRALGLMEVVTQCYGDLAILEADYKAGDEYVNTPEKYKAARAYVWGITSLQVSTLIAAKMASARVAAMIFRIIRYLAVGASAAVTAGASVAALLATEAMFLWFEAWIGSEEGKTWISKSFIMPIIRGFGRIPDGLIDSLIGHYKQADADKAAQDELPDDTVATAPAKPGAVATQPAAAKAKPAVAIKPMYINGIRVNNPDGSVNTAALSDPRVSTFVAKEVAAGRENPLVKAGLQ